MSKVSKSTKSATKATKGFQNPFRDGSNYHAIVAALLSMGSDKFHQYAAFETKVKKEWAGWKDFANKDARNEATAKDAEGKLRTNVAVLMRSDYGKPLHDQNRCIDLKWEGQNLLVRLNSHSSEPMNPGRQPKAAAPVKAAKVVKVKPKATKAQKGKATASAPILSGNDAIDFLRKGGKKKAAK